MTSIHRETAKIYQFPLMPRMRPDKDGNGASAATKVPLVVVDTCWYHDEAIKDEATNPERPKPC
jgi:hypothetical protein